MSNKFTPKAQAALNASLSIASEMGHSYVGSEHLLMGLLAADGGAAQKMLCDKGAGAQAVRKTVEVHS